MAEYVNVPSDTDPDSIAQEAYTYLEGVAPGWTPHDGELDVWLIEAFAQAAADLRDVATDVQTNIFRYFGASVIALPPVDATPAIGSTNWTLTDALGHTIPEGTVIGVPDGFGNFLPFQVTTTTVVPPASSTATNVPIEALDEGADGSGLGTLGTACSLLDQLAWVSGVVLAGATTGGTDAEDDTAYLNRLATALRLMSPRPILPADFSTLAETVAGVGRATAYDGYDAVVMTTGNERTISVAVTDEDGLAVSGGIKTNVLNYLDSLREVNFLVYVVDPSYSTVDVTYSATIYPGYSAAEVKARIDIALASFLSPALWGINNTAANPAWINKNTVKLNDLIVTIGKVDGVDDVGAVTQRISPAAYAAADIVMPGVFPLPLAGVMTGTVS